MPHPSRVRRRGQSPCDEAHRHSAGAHHALRGAHAYSAVADAGARNAARSKLPGVCVAANRRGFAARSGQPRPGAGRLGGGASAGAHAHARLDSPARQDAHRSIWRRDRARHDASRLSKPGCCWAGGSVRSGVDAAGGAIARRPAHRGAGELLDALLRRETGVGGLLWSVCRKNRPAHRRARRFCRHHVARHERRSALDGLQPAQAHGHDGCLRRRAGAHRGRCLQDHSVP